MAVVTKLSESEILVRNSALKWTLAWLFFLVLLFVPAIFCLEQAEKRTPQGGEVVPVWVGVVLLLFALMSCSMMLPFTVVSWTRMDKSSDIFVQDHGLLNCVPFSCYPSVTFPLSEIERIDVENFDGPQFHDIGLESSSDSSSEDEADVDPAERAQDEADKQHFKLGYIKPRAQVIVHTRFQSVPITAVTSGLPSMLPFRDKRMTAHEIKQYLDRFLGLTSAMEEEEADDEGTDLEMFAAANTDMVREIPAARERKSVSPPAATEGSTAQLQSSSGARPDNPRTPEQLGGGAAGRTSRAGGQLEEGRESQMSSAGKSLARSDGAGTGLAHREAPTPKTLSVGWGKEEEEEAGAEAGVVGVMDMDREMLEYVNIPPHMRAVRTAGPKLVVNPIGRPMRQDAELRALPDESGSPMKPSPATGPFAPRAKMEVASSSTVSAGDQVREMGEGSWARLPVQPWEDESGKGRKYPAKKKHETEEERKQRHALKKLAKKTESAEERAARKAEKAAKKARKSKRRSGGGGRGSGEKRGGKDSAGVAERDSDEGNTQSLRTLDEGGEVSESDADRTED